MDAATKVTEPERDFGDALAQASVLVVDDEAGLRHFLARSLSSRCKAVAVAKECDAAMALMEARHFGLVIVDSLMQGKRGVDWLAEQRAKGLLPPAILITAFADLETAIQALKAGASDFLLKPFRSNQILNAVARCLERVRLERENHMLRHELHANSDNRLLRDRLIGSSPAIEAVRQTIARVAPLPSSVLLTGPSGTGKEVAARLFLNRMAQQMGVPEVALTPRLEAGLAAYHWPGNVRELRNMIERTLILGRFPAELEAPITPRNGAGAEAPAETLAGVERQAILAALTAAGGDR